MEEAAIVFGRCRRARASPRPPTCVAESRARLRRLDACVSLSTRDAHRIALSKIFIGSASSILKTRPCPGTSCVPRSRRRAHIGRGRAHRSEAAGKRGHHAAPHVKVARDCGYFDPAYIERVEVFDSWYENPPDLPGRWYLQAICELFKENRLGLGRRLNLELIACPLYLLAGESGDITTREQVFAAENLVGTPKGRIEKKLVPRRTHRSLLGLAHVQGDVADDRAAASSFGLRLTLRQAWSRSRRSGWRNGCSRRSFAHPPLRVVPAVRVAKWALPSASRTRNTHQSGP